MWLLVTRKVVNSDALKEKRMRVSSSLRYLAATLIALALAAHASPAAEDQASISVSASTMGEGPTFRVRIVACDASGRCATVHVRVESGTTTSVDSMPLRAPGPLRRLRGTVSATTTSQIDYDLELYSGVRLVASAKGTTSPSDDG
jgi:hypothetical protein